MFKNAKEYLEFLYTRYLPRVYQYEDSKNDYQLKRYLESLVEGGLFKAYDETTKILNLIDLDKIPAKYLPELAGLLGFRFPYDLSEQTQRTYIKNAVASYKEKGTEETLLFMIRELTRLKTGMSLDKVNKVINIDLEINDDISYPERIVENVRFLAQEYAPPVKEINIVSTIVLTETFKRNMSYTEDMTSVTIQNNESYGYTRVNVEEKYGIISITDGTETVSLMVSEDLFNDIIKQTDNETATIQKVADENITTLSGQYDSEYPLSMLNFSENLHTASFSECYGRVIIEEDEEIITTV